MREGKSRAGRFMAVFLAAVVFVLSGSIWTAGDMTTFAAGAGADFGKETDFARVFDLAGLFSEAQEETLSGTIRRLRGKMNMDVAVVTAEDAKGLTGQEFGDLFYEENGMGAGKNASGVLFLIDLDNRELVISTEGDMIRYLTDERIETILDHVYEEAADGQFFEAAVVFLADTETYFDKGIPKNQYNYDAETGKISRYHSLEWYELLLAFGAASICGLAAVAAVVREYGVKGEDKRMAANFRLSYRKDSAFTLGNAAADVLLRSYVTQQVIRAAGNSGGGHSSSSGRSTTHRSSSGRTHGGGSRKF
ncbi:MAG: TPM domain-containing protein [Lachnospiraceae bacterium]|nr:TPM domain-containing protein [Lachnospiraceae bacterium]